MKNVNEIVLIKRPCGHQCYVLRGEECMACRKQAVEKNAAKSKK